MEEERCGLTDLIKGQCAHCRPALTQESAVFPAAPPWVTAQYHGRCSANRRHLIEPGDQIRSDGQGGWICACCE